jgi:hypothetical protein
MNTEETNITQEAVKTQVLQDFKNAAFIVSATINASLLLVWVLLHAAAGNI